MNENLATLEIKEYDDRWILSPMRGSEVCRVAWQADAVELLFSNSFRLIVGYDSELSPRSLAKDAPERKAITHWTRGEVENFLASPVVSPVFFKSGAARIAFKNGWKLILNDDPETSAVTLYDGESPLWTRTRLTPQNRYRIVRIDPWTGDSVTTPEWPPRPENLDVNYDSDDIND